MSDCGLGGNRMPGLGQLGLEFGDGRRAAHQLGLRGGDLLGGLRLLRLGELLDLVAVLDRVLDQLLDGVQVGVAHRGQLDRRQVEVVLDAVLDPHRHQRVQAELDQRHLPRQVLGLVAHGAADDRAEPLARSSHRESGDHFAKPAARPAPAVRLSWQDLGVVLFRSGGRGRNLLRHSHSGRRPRRAARPPRRRG